MPTYEYICDACGHEFEKFQSIKADPITLCPACGREKVRRKISGGAAIIFKGGGFYETDYRSENYNAGKKEAEGSEKSDGKSEAKPADSTGDQKKSEPKQSDSKAEPGQAGGASAPTSQPAPASVPPPSKPVPPTTPAKAD